MQDIFIRYGIILAKNLCKILQLPDRANWLHTTIAVETMGAINLGHKHGRIRDGLNNQISVAFWTGHTVALSGRSNSRIHYDIPPFI